MQISTRKGFNEVRNDYKDSFESWKASIDFNGAKALLRYKILRV